jgi:hypothetical protein
LHLQPRRPRPTTRCCISTARNAACPGGRLAAAGGAGSPGRGLPWQAVLAPPSGGTEEARRRNSGTKEGWRRDKEGEAARVWEKEPPIYILSC